MDTTAVAHEALPSHCRAIMRQPRLAELKLCLLAAAFVAIDGPRRCGFSTRGNYAREVLGMSGPAFSRRHKVGLYLLHSPLARQGLLAGSFSFSALETLLSHIPADLADQHLALLPGRSVTSLVELFEARLASPDAFPDSSPPASSPSAHIGNPPPGAETLLRLRLRVPEPLARLHASNLRLASLLCGNDVDEPTANEAWLATISDEYLPSGDDSVSEPWRILGLPHPGSLPRHKPHREPSLKVDLQAPQNLRRRSRLAPRIDSRLERAARDYRRSRALLQDQLLELQQSERWRELGYIRAEDFAQEVLQLPRRTWFQYLRDARRRRRDDPLALALRDGRIGDWAARRLDEFRRSAHIGNSALPAWIAAAESNTARALLEKIALAKQWSKFESRRYALDGWPVPTNTQLLGPDLSIEALLETPDIPEEAHFLATPQVTIEIQLTHAVYDHFLMLWGSLHQSRRRHRPESPPVSSLMVLMLQARISMLELANAAPKPTRNKLLLRDRWRCQNPGCNRRVQLEGHHMKFLSRGGPDTPSNIIMLCHHCHQHLVHTGRLRISGVADDPANPPLFELSIDEAGIAHRRYRGGRKLGPSLPSPTPKYSSDSSAPAHRNAPHNPPRSHIGGLR